MSQPPDLDGLSPQEKRALLEMLMRQKAARKQHAAATFGPASRDQPLPLSFAQERMWLVERLDPGSAAWNVATPLQLDGPLDVARLQQSLDALVARHEPLRTTFPEEGGSPVQRIANATSVPLPVVELSDRHPPQREEALRRLIDADARAPFDLSRGPLARFTLIRLGATRHVLLWTQHHIITDGVSGEVLIEELFGLYRGVLSNAAPPPLQYADFAAWQRQAPAPEALAPQVAWWREALAGIPSRIELPFDRPRPTARSFAPAGSVDRVVPAALTAAVRELGLRAGVTPYVLLLATWQLLLHRLSGQQDVVVGSPSAGRAHPETQRMVGFFVNTLVMRARFGQPLTFRALLEQVKSHVLGAWDHQSVPFERLVEELKPERNLSHAPLFQVFFVLQGSAGSPSAGDGLSVTPLRPSAGAAVFDLNLVVGEVGAELALTLEYDRQLFEHATASRILDAWVGLLDAAVRTPDESIEDLPLLDAKTHALLAQWSRGDMHEVAEHTFHRAFQDRAAASPDAIAVEGPQGAYSYGELERRSNQWGRQLRTLGASPGVFVGLCLEPGPEAIAVLLGILKAGAAYLPLDPTYPPERLAGMIEDARPGVIVTRGAIDQRLHLRAERIVRLEEVEASVAAQPSDAFEAGARPNDTAYVIYTSGSTGRPKGTVVPHRGALHVVREVAAACAIDHRSRTLLTMSMGFDASVSVIFGALLTGGTLVTVPREELIPGPELAALMRRRDISFFMFPPSAVAKIPVEGLDCVRGLVVGGESCPPELVDQWAPGRRMLNTYGPTEASISATIERCRAGEGKPSIGRPLPNTAFYVLGPKLEPLFPGMVGEVYLGGVGVTLGYLGAPELTAEKFVPDPFAAAPGQRMYRTGDLARFRHDGTIEFVGRADQQIKLRGFRIELGEIASVLREVPGVRDAVVHTRSFGGDPRLVAWFIGDALEGAALRAQLGRRLPEFMVPSALMRVDSFPLGPNGKLDLMALPDPRPLPELERERVAPRDPREGALEAIFAELLGMPAPGIDANFFELGGHSLLATQMASRIRERLQVELPVRAIFEAPTVRALGEYLDRSGRRRAGEGPIALARAERLPLSYAQERLWFLGQLEPGSAAYNVPAALRLKGALDVGALERALSELIRRHEPLRTRFRSDGEAVWQVIDDAAPVRLTVEALSSIAEARARAEVDATRPFDLENGPLLRASLLRLSDEEHLLLLCMHHIVTDGWSMSQVFFRELWALYETGGASSLPPLAIQYADFAAWQRNWLSGGVLDAQLAYWREQLAELTTLALPTDRVRPAVQTANGARASGIRLDAEATRALRTLAREEGATLFMVVLSAFGVLLHRYSGQTDLAVGTSIAGRTRAELEGLIGSFVNTLVMRLRWDEEPTFRELIGQARTVALEAYANQDLPFERLVEELRPPRDLSRTPLFQVMFELVQGGAAVLTGPRGLEVQPFEAASTPAKFDLLVAAVEEEDALSVDAEFNTDLFDAPTVQRMLEQLGAVLRSLAAEPGARIGEVVLDDEQTRRRVLEEWNATSGAYPERQTLAELFEAQVKRTPHAVAARDPGESATYAELDHRANGLGALLAEEGAGPEEVVAVLDDRGVRFLSAVLGIFKAGGAYVPLDPGHPPERMAQVLRESRTRLVLASRAYGDVLERAFALLEAEAPGVLWLEDACVRRRADPPERRGGVEDLAYVIFTSGSTGVPKGAMVEVRGMVNHLYAKVKDLELTADDVVAQTASQCFDISVWQYLVALVLGGRVEVYPDDVAHDPRRLLEAVEREGVTVLEVVPSMLRAMLDELEGGFDVSLAKLRWMVPTGEALPPELCRRWFARYPNIPLVNAYGPTECSDDVTHALLRAAPETAQTPVGRPVLNLRAYVLDAKLRPAPLGVAGELCIGGVGVGRGYLGRPELTAERFVPDPFGDAGARLYRTGDWARWRSDGQLEYLGRIDHQVKVRGFRIELGEIEAALEKHPAVGGSVVLALADPRGEKRLVGYVVGNVQPDALKAHLKARLPEYMIPSALVVLEALPLTSNGKVDRKRLPAPELALQEAAFVAPRSPAEQTLAALWRDLLGVDQVGLHASFFELGGHSLLATRLLSRIQEAFGVELRLFELFEAQDLDAQAALIARRLSAGSEGQPELHARSAVWLRRVQGTTPWVCLHPLLGSGAAYLNLAAQWKDASVLVLQAPELFSDVRFESIEARAVAYARSVNDELPDGPLRLLGYSSGGVIAQELARVLKAQGRTVEVLVLVDTSTRLCRPSGAPDPDALDEAARLERFAIENVDPQRVVEFQRLDANEPRRRWLVAYLKELLVLSDGNGADQRLAGAIQAALGVTWAVQHHVPRPSGVRTVVCVSEESARVAEGALLLGWDALGDQVLGTGPVPGSHFGMMMWPSVREVARTVDAAVAELTG